MQPDWYMVKYIGIAIAGVIALVASIVLFSNWQERVKCHSLNTQGVKSYVAETTFLDECIVVERYVTNQGDKQ